MKSLVLAAALVAPAASLACGVCDEDRIAATYDHAVTERAAARGEVMVYCAVSGPFDARRLKQAARHAPGVQPRSVRVSAQPAALSFALDEKLQSPQEAIDAAQRELAPATRLTLLNLPAPPPRAVR